MFRKTTLFTLLLMSGLAYGQKQIVNQAFGEYAKEEQTPVQRTSSNSVTAITTEPLPPKPVPEQCNVNVSPSGTVASPALTREVLPSDTAVFPYTVTNRGTTVANFPLTAAQVEGDSVRPTISVHIDSNNNGQVDIDELPIQNITLIPGASEKLLVKVVAETSGKAYINLTASCVLSGARDDDNISLLVIGAPPSLQVDKGFSPETISPGNETTVTVVTTNTSDREAQQVVLTDSLTSQIAQGLEYVPGSAVVSTGQIEYFNGQTWTATAPATVSGIRVTVARLAPKETVKLTFRMRATDAADGRAFVNIARAVVGNHEVADDAALQVKSHPSVAIGPVGTPLAPENTPADSQTQVTVGGEVCFNHTLKNTGDVADVFTVNITYPVGQAQHTLYGTNGQPLVQPLLLQPGEETTVRVCYTPQGNGVVEALLTVTGARGTSNTTRDYLRPQPELLKTVVGVSPQVEKDNIALAEIGSEVTYQLRVTNTYGLPLTGVQLVDTLPAAVDYVSSVPSGRVEGVTGTQRVVWDINTLAPGQKATVEVTVRVTDRAQMGETLSNTFELVTSELPPLVSPPATVQVPIKIQITKRAEQQEVNLGDRVRFTLTVTNPSPVAALRPVEVIDALAYPETLDYIPGTSTVAYGGGKTTPLVDPVISTRTFKVPFAGRPANTPIDEVMQWTLPELKPKETATITYEMRVEPAAAEHPELSNFVWAIGTGPGGASDIAEDASKTAIILRLNAFKPMADLVGTVFVDRNRSGSYEKEIDTPVNRARVVLAGGRISLTDKDGRYSFLNVPLGTHAVRLDPSTTPYSPLVMPREGGLIGTQTAHLHGSITTVDFPLAPLGGDITVVRRTTVKAGALTLHKVIFATAEGYVVNLYLDAAQNIPQVRITDPLPQGAALAEGSNEFFGPLDAGARVLSYRFSYEGEPRTAVTDPQVEWR